MTHLHLSFEGVMKMPLVNLSLFISESSPRLKKDNEEVELDTYYGKVKAKRKFII